MSKSLSKGFVLGCVNHYQELVEYYNGEITEKKRMMVNPKTSDKKRHVYKLLIEAMEKEKRECQKNIRRLLNE